MNEIVHVRNLEKYQPGYKDRKHLWAKVYWEIFLDEDYQALTEIDRYRLISLIVFEVYREGKPVVLTATNLTVLGWNNKKQHISLTLRMLQKFVDSGTDDLKACDVDKSRIDKKENRIDKLREEGRWKPPTLSEVKAYIESEKKLSDTVNPETFFNCYAKGDPPWTDTQGKPVRNWKLKAHTWASHADKGKTNAGDRSSSNAKRFASQQSAYGETIDD